MGTSVTLLMWAGIWFPHLLSCFSCKTKEKKAFKPSLLSLFISITTAANLFILTAEWGAAGQAGVPRAAPRPLLVPGGEKGYTTKDFW